MSTAATLDTYESNDGTQSWRLYEELFESDAVYLELKGVAVELEVTDEAKTRVVVRLPLEMARRLATAEIDAAKWDDIAKGWAAGTFDPLRPNPKP
ncbi:hypothetical protein [Caballeronia sp. GACF4]|uniref:hypothetical protein n=1 Tax=Caballeronia sp. GACF4 TaxID=2921763 RepID=UPI002028F0EA|nr:hypothetical protein [Caballeronia sp. GACF4]